MLRGLDARRTASDYEPTIVKVADRPSVAGQVTVYVDEALSPETHRRLRHVRERFDLFAEAGVAPSPTVVCWPAEVAHSASDEAGRVVARYEEFREVLDSDALGPFYERTAEGVSMPDLCVAFRRDGRLSGLYPRVKDGHVQTVDECLTALAAGNDVENIAE